MIRKLRNDTDDRVVSPVLKLVQSSRRVRWFGRALFVVILISVVFLAIVPWRQSAKGTGRVIAYVPQERQQPITSPIKGVVETIAPELREGDFVKAGQFILELRPSAANMSEQIAFQELDLQNKLESARIKAEVYRQNIKDFTDARDFSVKAAQEMVESTEAKLLAKRESVPGYEAKELQVRLNYERQKQLFDQGAFSEKELEKVKKDWDVALSDLASAEHEVISAEKEVEAKKHELDQKRSEGQTKIDYSRAMEQDAIGLEATVQKELREIAIKQSELKQLTITAPRDGTIYRLPIFERGQSVKEGEQLFVLVPETAERAVELWISGNDISLIKVGDHVRLQFEGWPAVQFAGWPSVAVGTFGGEVARIDPTDDGKGKFRIQVVPDTSPDAAVTSIFGAGQSWPSNQYLRQGVRANGWVMLRRVTLGYELWRQLNGFPPVVSETDPSNEEKPDKINLPK
jgi:multidrug resistance efflux pump